MTEREKKKTRKMGERRIREIGRRERGCERERKRRERVGRGRREGERDGESAQIKTDIRIKSVYPVHLKKAQTLGHT